MFRTCNRFRNRGDPVGRKGGFFGGFFGGLPLPVLPGKVFEYREIQKKTLTKIFKTQELHERAYIGREDEYA